MFRNKLDKRILAYVLSAILSSWAFVFFIKVFHLSRTPLTVVMVIPLVLAFFFILISKGDKFRTIGWKIPQVKYWLICIFLPILIVVLVLGAGFCFGLLSYNDQHVLAHKPTQSIRLNLLFCLPGLFIPGIILSIPNLFLGWLNHLGEEFAWRGYLFRKIWVKSGSLITGVLISGSVWWAWHLPLFWLSPILRKLNFLQVGLTVFLSFFALLGTAAIYSWVYIRSRSIWAPTLMHLVWNLYRGVLTGRLADSAPGVFKGNLWLVNGEGIIGNGITILVGFLFFILLIRLGQRNSWKLSSIP